MNHTVEQAAQVIIRCFQQGSKLLLCGNGGSSADCAHIAGELCKGFLSKRRPEEHFVQAVGEEWAGHLQRGLPAIDLTAQSALMTAIINDISGEDVYAQKVMAYGQPGDVLLGLSTSGNAENVRRAALVAKARGLTVIGMTGHSGGKLKDICDILLNAEASETYLVQEQHIQMYHRLCLMVEEAMFGEDGKRHVQPPAVD